MEVAAANDVNRGSTEWFDALRRLAGPLEYWELP
jgi:hypothetical protein